MSISAIKACSKIDCSARALKRKRYNCPLCELTNLDPGNFTKHMVKAHKWDKYKCKNYRTDFDKNSSTSS